MSTDVGLHLLAGETSAVGLGLCRRRADAPDLRSCLRPMVAAFTTAVAAVRAGVIPVKFSV